MTIKPALKYAALLATLCATPLCAQTTSTETTTAQSTETVTPAATAAPASLRPADAVTTSAEQPADVETDAPPQDQDAATTAPETAVAQQPPVPQPSIDERLRPNPSTTSTENAETTAPPAPASPPTDQPAPTEETSTEVEPTSFPEPSPQIPNSDATTVTLNNGLAYQVLRAGTGREADTTSTRRIHYTLWRADGTYIESSRRKEYPTPFEFVPESRQAIAGMEQGTASMRIGEVRKIFIPSRLAYGTQEKPNIPANSDLIFVVELVDLVKPDPTE